MANLLRGQLPLALTALLSVPAIAADPIIGAPVQAPAGYLAAHAIYCPDTNGKAQACPFGIIPQLVGIDRGGNFGTTAVQLMPANATRHFIQLQNQGTAACYINGQAGATPDFHSLMIAAGGYFESSSHVGVGAISIVCAAANTPVFAREG